MKQQMTNVKVVVGGQYGSEAKGATVAYLSRELTDRDVVIRVAGPNAGHTAYDKDGREWKLRAVPVAAVVNHRVRLHLAAGSEIDEEVLANEVRELEDAGHKIHDRLTIHPSATILEPKHHRAEFHAELSRKIGSTGKGIGAARADRIMRTAKVAGEVYAPSLMSNPGPFDLDGIGTAIVEGTQGYGLGLHTANYPQVTSSDCRAIDFLAMAGISPWSHRVWNTQVLVVARCFPIRVAGNSGPMLGETSWDALGLPEERTTVTNKVRRVGAWDMDLLEEAVAANGGGGWNPDVQLVVTMLDQKFPETRGVTDQEKLSAEAVAWLEEVQDDLETDITAVGTSPTTMFEVGF